VSLTTKACTVEGCTKVSGWLARMPWFASSFVVVFVQMATHNVLGERKPLYCASHAAAGMWRTSERPCVVEACGKAAMYNFDGTSHSSQACPIAGHT
jgi:hypothetical protein